MPREGHDHIDRSLRGAYIINISIHVPREGHDRTFDSLPADKRAISIHVPREGHDCAIVFMFRLLVLFQSTCPARGTTAKICDDWFRDQFQSTCPARGTTAPEPP